MLDVLRTKLPNNLRFDKLFTILMVRPTYPILYIYGSFSKNHSNIIYFCYSKQKKLEKVF